MPATETQRAWNECNRAHHPHNYGVDPRSLRDWTITSDTPLTEEEVKRIDEARERYCASYAVVRKSDGAPDSLDIEYRGARPFERIRRITGYLVGTLDRWNGAKRAEERDRVTHGTEGLAE